MVALFQRTNLKTEFDLMKHDALSRQAPDNESRSQKGWYLTGCGCDGWASSVVALELHRRAGVRKRVIQTMPFCTKTEGLPRQAQDKYRKTLN